MKDQVFVSISWKFEDIILTNIKDMNVERCAVDAIKTWRHKTFVMFGRWWR